MKQGLLILLAFFIITSCDISIYDEQPYDARQYFLGSYSTEEYSETYGVFTMFPIDIVTNSDPYSNRIYLRNFYDSGIEVYARVNELRFTIPRQRVGHLVIQGTGTAVQDGIMMTYSVQDLSNQRLPTDFCNALLYYY